MKHSILYTPYSILCTHYTKLELSWKFMVYEPYAKLLRNDSNT